MDHPESAILNTGLETKQSSDQNQVDSSPAVTFREYHLLGRDNCYP